MNGPRNNLCYLMSTNLFATMLGLIMSQLSGQAYGDLTPDQLILGLKQRESSIRDVTYTVDYKQYYGGSKTASYHEKGVWKEGKGIWFYDYVRMYSEGDVFRKLIGAYNGKTLKNARWSEGDQVSRGQIKNTNDLGEARIFSCKSFHLTWGKRALSEVFTDDKIKETKSVQTPSGEYWLMGKTTVGEQCYGILVDPQSGFYPKTIAFWVPGNKGGGTRDKPMISYYTRKLKAYNGIWFPLEAECISIVPKDEQYDTVISKVSFDNVKINSGLSADDVTFEWPGLKKGWPGTIKIQDDLANRTHTIQTQ